MVEPLAPLPAIVNVVLPLGVYCLLMSLSRHIGRTSLWMITVMFFAAFQMVLLYMYGRSVIAVDMFLNLVTTNPGEVGELLGNLLPIIAAVVLVYVTPIVASVVAVVKKWRLSEKARLQSRLAGYLLSGVGLACMAASFASVKHYDLLTDLYPVNVLYNVGIAVDRTARMADYEETSRDFTYHATPTHPDSVPEVYVAVIGETSRATNWQLLGYGRPTTPELMNRDGLVAFPRALSQSNTTHKSVPMLLSMLDASNFADSLYYSKSLITAFKEAGFHTAFFSNQNRNHSFIDRFGEEADTCVFIRETGNVTGYDTALLTFLDRELEQGHKKLFVVLHAYGSHFSYMDRYPAAEARFQPSSPADASAMFRDELVNAYDNTIALTSRFLASIMDRLAKTGARSALIYTSDHGEDIFDDSRNLFLHASPCPSYFQIHVPFLVWMSPTYLEAYPEIYEATSANREKFVASSKAYFHTLMDLAGISTPLQQPDASVANRNYEPKTAYYLNDHNRMVSLREAGLLDVDFVSIDSLAGISY